MSRDPLVGVFDSGVGGLTVASALRGLLPTVPLRYLADGAWFPYGERSPAEIEARSVVLTEQLVAAGCRLVVVACNTATSAAIPTLRARFSIPIVGMEPPIKPALAGGGRGRVVVLVTPATARGERLERLRRELGASDRVDVVPMPGLADLVEAGEVEGERVEGLLREALDGVTAHASHVVLGCTHYGFLRGLLAAMLGPGVEILDAAEPVARRVRQQLEVHGVELPTGPAGAVEVSTTGDPARLEATLRRLGPVAGLGETRLLPLAARA